MKPLVTAPHCALLVFGLSENGTANHTANGDIVERVGTRAGVEDTDEVQGAME